jgi:purine-binding chemotaxis protein CheW
MRNNNSRAGEPPDRDPFEPMEECLDSEPAEPGMDQDLFDVGFDQPLAEVELTEQEQGNSAERAAAAETESGTDGAVGEGLEQGPGENVESEEKVVPPLEQLLGEIDSVMERAPVPKAGDETGSRETPGTGGEDCGQYVRFLMDDILLAIPLSSVLEVGRRPVITALPNLPEWILGVSNIRGEVISVINLSTFFERPSRGTNKEEHLIIVHNQELKVGVMVDRIVGILHLDRVDSSVQPSPYKENGGLADFISGVAVAGKEVVNILDTGRLLLSPRMTSLYAGEERVSI